MLGVVLGTEGRLFGLLFWLVSACSEAPEFVPAPDLAEGDLMFILRASFATGLSIDGPYAGEDRYSATRSIQVEDDDRLYILEVPLDRLRALNPILDESRLMALAIELGAEVCEGGRKSSNAQRYPLAAVVPTMLALEGEEWVSETTPGDLTLVLPSDQAQCWARPTPVLRAFGDELLLLRPGFPIDVPPSGQSHDQLEEARPLGPNHFIISTAGSLKVFEHGRAWANEPEHLLGFDALPPSVGQNPYLFQDVLVGPEQDAGDYVLRIAFVEGRDSSGGGRSGGVASARWNPSSGFSPLEVLWESPNLRLYNLKSRAGGRWTAIGDGGAILRGDFASPDVVESRLPGGGDLRRLLYDESPEAPVVIADTSLNLYFGDLETNVWQRELSGSLFSGLSGAALRRTMAGVEIFLAPFSAQLGRRDIDGHRSELLVDVPPEAANCMGPDDACGARLPSGLAGDLALTPDGTLLIGLKTCGFLVEVNLDKTCTRAIPIPFESDPDRDSTEIRATAFAADRLLVTGTNGLVAEADWPPP